MESMGLQLVTKSGQWNQLFCLIKETKWEILIVDGGSWFELDLCVCVCMWEREREYFVDEEGGGSGAMVVRVEKWEGEEEEEERTMWFASRYE